MHDTLGMALRVWQKHGAVAGGAAPVLRRPVKFAKIDPGRVGICAVGVTFKGVEHAVSARKRLMVGRIIAGHGRG